jgi:hypothetical protein
MKFADSITLSQNEARHGRSMQRFAIVWDWAAPAKAHYIWDPDTDVWYGPFATRSEAELTLVQWRAHGPPASTQRGADR